MRNIYLRTFIMGLLLSCGLVWGDVPTIPFSDRWVPDGDVYAVARSNGKVYIGGNFEVIGPFTGSGVVFSPTGDLDSSWPQVNGGGIDVAVSDGSGGWYVGGGFSHIGGVQRRYIGHINSNGTLDRSWDPPDPNDKVTSLVVSGGKVYAGGYFTSVGGTPFSHLARFNEAGGTLDSAWDPPDLNNQVTSLAVSGGKVYAGGFFTSVDGIPFPYLARFNESDAALDNAWNPPDPNEFIFSIASSGGKIYAGGRFTSLGGMSFPYLARFNESDGALDSAWDPPNLPNVVFSIALSGGKVYVGGQSGILRRFNESDGSRDNTWTPPSFSGSVLSLAVIGGNVYSGGSFSMTMETSYSRLARFNEADGTLDKSWNPPRPNQFVYAISVSDGKVFVGGDFNGMGGIPCAHFARFNESDGSLDKDWNPPTPNSTVNSLVVSGGKIYLGGYFTRIGNANLPNLARLNESNGTLDSSWAPNSDRNNKVDSLAVSGGKVYVGWWVTKGTFFHSLERYNVSDGRHDNNWNPPSPNDTINSILIFGGKVYVGGMFKTLGGASFPYLARLNESDGALDSAWNPPDPDGYAIYTLAASDGKVYAGGTFSSLGGKSFPYIARFNESDGALDSAWNPPDPNGLVSSLVVSTGKVYVGGSFTTLGGTPFPYLARFNEADGALDSDWNPTDPDGEIKSIAVSGNSLRIGGSFNSIGGQGPAKLAWFGNAFAPVSPVSGGITTVNSQSVSATWSSVVGAISYTLAASLNNTTPPISAESLDTFSSNNGTISGLSPNRAYYLFVNACESGCSSYLELGSTVTLANAPISLSTTVVTNTTVGLSFGANGNPVGTSYLVQQGSGVGGPFATVLTTTLITPTITGLDAGTTYYFQVLARNSVGAMTALVGPVSAVTGLTPPGLILGPVGATSVHLTIAPNGNPAGTVYQVQKSVDNGMTFTVATTGTELAVTVAGLSAGTRYQFRVAAVTQEGTLTTPSPVVLATPGEFSVDTARAYPVPFRPGQGRDTLTFDQLPNGATVKLYTISGQIVKMLSVEGNRVDWDGNNQDGQPVTSGVYIAFVDGSGGKKSLKVVVQR